MSDSNVITLHENDIDKILDIVKESSKELRAIAITGVTENGDVLSTWKHADNLFQLIGSIEALKAEVIHHSLEL